VKAHRRCYLKNGGLYRNRTQRADYTGGEGWMPVNRTGDANEVQRSLGRRIRDLRSRHGWSQEQFAGLCGLHRTYMGHVERGEKNVSLSTVLKVAGALGVRLSELFGQAQSRPQPAPVHLSRRHTETVPGLTSPAVRSLLDELQVQRRTLKQVVRELRELLARGVRSGGHGGGRGRS
jgi:transcriptional regulator with XRE-family HTH domain